MNLISVYVAVGAISFVKGEFGHDFASPSQDWHPNQLRSGDWRVRGNDVKDKRLQAEDSKEDLRKRRDLSGGEEEEEEDELGGTNELFEGFRQLRSIYEGCRTKVYRRLKKLAKTEAKSEVGRNLLELREFLLSLYRCVKVFTFRSLDRVLEEDYVPLTDYAYFVKDGVNATEGAPGATGRGSRTGVSEYATAVLSKDWATLVYDRLEALLRSHSLKFQTDQSLTPQGRSRRRDHRMFAMMMMGFMIMAGILIPMGFQFLTVLGGKSLLMAKMALIMSAISGLKKIATSNVGYGFYHTGSDGHHHDHIHHGFHEKHFHVNPQSGPAQYGFSK